MSSSKRINWGKKYPNLPEINLIKIQKDSWQQFIEKELQETLQSISPISDYTGNNWELQLGDLVL
jgi:DNA-directed RNA polymerase beta subunit